MEYIVYHSTGVNFNRFSLKKSTQGLLWFIDNKQAVLDNTTGAGNNNYLLTCKIKINNPAGWDEYDKLDVREMKEKGFDGIILKEDESNTYVVWETKQVKIVKREQLHESLVNKILKEAYNWKLSDFTIPETLKQFANDNKIALKILINNDMGTTIFDGIKGQANTNSNSVVIFHGSKANEGWILATLLHEIAHCIQNELNEAETWSLAHSIADKLSIN